ncbi:hypothetical protein pb186bvf_015638 [Paramecium bursaria]
MNLIKSAYTLGYLTTLVSQGISWGLFTQTLYHKDQLLVMFGECSLQDNDNCSQVRLIAYLVYCSTMIEVVQFLIGGFVNILFICNCISKNILQFQKCWISQLMFVYVVQCTLYTYDAFIVRELEIDPNVIINNIVFQQLLTNSFLSIQKMVILLIVFEDAQERIKIFVQTIINQNRIVIKKTENSSDPIKVLDQGFDEKIAVQSKQDSVVIAFKEIQSAISV